MRDHGDAARGRTPKATRRGGVLLARCRSGVFWIVAAVTLLTALRVGAHDRSVSYASWSLPATTSSQLVQVRLRMSRLDLNALRGVVRADLRAHLITHVAVSQGELQCEPLRDSFRSWEEDEGWRGFGWSARCAGGVGPWRVRGDVLAAVARGHVHFATLRLGPDRRETFVLTSGEPGATWAPDEGERETGLGAFIMLGVEHILSGWDHLVFLWMLVLVSVRVREVAWAVTGFTLGHSATLSVGALGWVTPRVAVVEGLIGLSIVIMAAENVWQCARERRRGIPRALLVSLCVLAAGAWWVRPQAALALTGVALWAGCHLALVHRSADAAQWRWLAAALFGLVHGLGFAGVLGETGLAGQDRWVGLLGFNLGVELGQLAVLALGWPLWRWVTRDERWRERLIVAGSALGALVGSYWFIERLS